MKIWQIYILADVHVHGKMPKSEGIRAQLVIFGQFDYKWASPDIFHSTLLLHTKTKPHFMTKLSKSITREFSIQRWIKNFQPSTTIISLVKLLLIQQVHCYPNCQFISISMHEILIPGTFKSFSVLQWISYIIHIKGSYRTNKK